ncbi:uncharacterized protein F5891DRAFT_984461 [Suillus fuscotomentosus]|uniref:Uncharacterized protein n=1 Tax=Suillus fuscotomentosus TaxID=1912939 RepID=A0AAD4HG08_9AGAM|nr:uncharacterized protein F5891DRAFT_984461 [Suillus fuscotomentosus]KAG1895137.1 hypothetical protein F5891DRAFT_984461 [Suillus fuscotomentosus]
MINDTFLADEQDISDYKPSGDSELDTDAETDNDLKELESSCQLKQLNHLPWLPGSRQTAEPFPFSSAQPKAPMASRAKAQSVRDRKRENKTPVWVDHSNDVEELKAASNDYANPKSPNNNFLVLDDDNDDNDNHHGHSQGPKLVQSRD